MNQKVFVKRAYQIIVYMLSFDKWDQETDVMEPKNKQEFQVTKKKKAGCNNYLWNFF